MQYHSIVDRVLLTPPPLHLMRTPYIAYPRFIVCTPLSAGGGELDLQPNFQKGEAWQDLNF